MDEEQILAGKMQSARAAVNRQHPRADDRRLRLPTRTMPGKTKDLDPLVVEVVVVVDGEPPGVVLVPIPAAQAVPPRLRTTTRRGRLRELPALAKPHRHPGQPAEQPTSQLRGS